MTRKEKIRRGIPNRPVKKRDYIVRLNVPTRMWALVPVSATCEEDAVKQAFEANKAGTVSYEFAGFDISDAELVEVEVQS